MLRKLRVPLLALGSLLVMSGSAAAQAAKSACRPADEMSARVVEYFGSLLTPTTPAETKLRDDLGLTRVTASQVVRVGDRRVCAKAAKAMQELAEREAHEGRHEQQHEDSDAKQPAIYVVHVGDAYGVVDPTWKSGEYVPAVLFDKGWKLRRVLLAF